MLSHPVYVGVSGLNSIHHNATVEYDIFLFIQIQIIEPHN